jgi:hypothetical protein
VTPDRVAFICTLHSDSNMLRRDVSFFDCEALENAHKLKFADELARKISNEPNARAKLSISAKNLIYHGVSKRIDVCDILRYLYKNQLDLTDIRDSDDILRSELTPSRKKELLLLSAARIKAISHVSNY